MHPRHDIKNCVYYIKEHLQKDDIILHSSRVSFMPALFYAGSDKIRSKMFISKLLDNPNFDSLFLSAIYNLASQKKVKGFIDRHIDLEEAANNFSRLWFMQANWETAWDFDTLSDWSKEVKNYLDEKCSLQQAREFKGIRLYLYKTES